MTADIQTLSALHRLRVAQKARELRARSRFAATAALAHQSEVAAQQALFAQSDGAVASLGMRVNGKIAALDIRFASDFAFASRAIALAKAEGIKKLKYDSDEAAAQREVARNTWQRCSVRLQSIESVADQCAAQERKLHALRDELTTDEGFLDRFCNREETVK